MINIQIDNRIVRNNKISNEAFLLYAELLYLKFLNKQADKISIYHLTLMKYLNWKDKRKLKNSLMQLHSLNLIKGNFNILPKFKQIEITFTKYNSKHYTYLPDTLIKNINIIGDIGFRLIYYYKSFINNVNMEYAFPSLQTISQDLNISEKTIIKYNKILEKHKLITIEVHELSGKHFNKNSKKYFTKFSNYYYINLKNIKNFK